MKTGLILGKFMPLHSGHIAMVNFALKHCDVLVLLLCSNTNEPINGATRFTWLRQTFEPNSRILLRPMVYDQTELPDTSVSSLEASFLWSKYLMSSFPDVNVIFTSEPYGEYVASAMKIDHMFFDQARLHVQVSSSNIRSNPFKYWNFIPPAVRPFYVKKVCISGTESTGKSMLTIRLAKHFNTNCVPETARAIIDKTVDVAYDDLKKIASTHASAINDAIKQANKFLFCDTDLNITHSYAEYLFQQQLFVPAWVEEANTFHLHLFLEPDCEYVQDGTRLGEAERNALSEYHKRQLDKRGVLYIPIKGDWNERFEKAVMIIEEIFLNDKAYSNQHSTNIPS